MKVLSEKASHRFKAISGTLMIVALIFSITAPVTTASTINWAYISSTIEGATTIFGSVVAVIIAIVPIIIVMAIAFFIVSLISDITRGVKSKIGK